MFINNAKLSEVINLSSGDKFIMPDNLTQKQKLVCVIYQQVFKNYNTWTYDYTKFDKELSWGKYTIGYRDFTVFRNPKDIDDNPIYCGIKIADMVTE